MRQPNQIRLRRPLRVRSDLPATPHTVHFFANKGFDMWTIVYGVKHLAQKHD